MTAWVDKLHGSNWVGWHTADLQQDVTTAEYHTAAGEPIPSALAALAYTKEIAFSEREGRSIMHTPGTYICIGCVYMFKINLVIRYKRCPAHCAK
jgi:hypothetical protein